MHVSLFRVFSLLILISIFCAPKCFCQDGKDNYEDCGKPFKCGSLENVSYPFYGEDRPEYCGYPGFELKCESDDPLITIQSVPYRVLKVNDSAPILTVARYDLWEDICRPSPHNTTPDLNTFKYSMDYPNITIYYGCSLFPGLSLPNEFCTSNSNGFSFYLTMEVPFSKYASSPFCDNNITVPINPAAFPGIADLRSSVDNLSAALRDGFELDWFANNTKCSECTQSGGRCGHADTNSFICYCADGTYDTNICRSDNKKKSTALSVGLGIAGVVIVSIGLGWLIFFCRRRRKRVAVAKASLSPEAVSKEIITTTSSKALISSTTSTFTTSIPSYPSSKSDLGRGSSYFGVQIFSYSELEEATDNFSSSRELGDGGFGAVYYGTLADGRVVAVKRLYENNFKRQEQFMNEVEILARLRHKNLVHLYGCTSKRSRDLLLVYEYIPNGTVADHLHGKRAKSGLLSWPVRLNIAIETAEALAYLHKSDIIHRDVKSTNILLDNEFHVKVADFGLSRLFPNDVTHVSTAPQGTPGYVDPEYYQVYRLTERSDVFSFGVVLIELISSLQAVDINRHRHDINLANMAVNKIQTHALHELVDQSLGFETNNSVRKMTSLVAELAFRCLQQERDVRPSMQEVLETLRGIQKEDLEVEEEEFVEIMIDDVALLKGNIDTPSPGSADKSAKSTTPNSV